MEKIFFGEFKGVKRSECKISKKEYEQLKQDYINIRYFLCPGALSAILNIGFIGEGYREGLSREPGKYYIAKTKILNKYELEPNAFVYLYIKANLLRFKDKYHMTWLNLSGLCKISESGNTELQLIDYSILGRLEKFFPTVYCVYSTRSLEDFIRFLFTVYKNKIVIAIKEYEKFINESKVE